MSKHDAERDEPQPGALGATGTGAPPSSDTYELLMLLQRFTLETERYVTGLGVQHSLHRTDLNALAAVLEASRQGQVATPGYLRQALNLSSPATTALIDRLEGAGHLRRKRSAVDRRQVHVEATELALEVGSALFAPLASQLGAVIDHYSAAERALIERFLVDAVAATQNAAAAAKQAAANS